MNKRQRKKALKKFDTSFEQALLQFSSDLKKAAVYRDRAIKRIFIEFLESYKNSHEIIAQCGRDLNIQLRNICLQKLNSGFR